MVYESGFTTRRTYSSRPVVTSYAVSVYKSSYPIVSSFSIPNRVCTGSHTIFSPTRIVKTPVLTKSRVIFSPARTPMTYSLPYCPEIIYDSYESSFPTHTDSFYYNSPRSRISTYSLNSPFRIISSTPSYPKRSLQRSHGYKPVNYRNSDHFEIFKNETNRIRFKAQSLVRDIHTPVIRRARSCTPFPISGYPDGSASQLALDAYVARITNPSRHAAKEVHRIFRYPQPARKRFGKSNLASVRICGDKAYNIRRPLYSTSKVQTDIYILSWYLNPHGKREITKEGDLAVRDYSELDPNRPSRKFYTPDSADKSSEGAADINEETTEIIEANHNSPKLLNESSLLTRRAPDEEIKNQASLSKKTAKQIERNSLEPEKAINKTIAQKQTENLRLAEEARLIEEARLVEETRLAEEARLVEETLMAEEARLVEETRSAEEARLVEETLMAEEARLVEETRLAEEARLVEETRLAEQVKSADEIRLAEEIRLFQEPRLTDEVPINRENILVEESLAKDGEEAHLKTEIENCQPTREEKIEQTQPNVEPNEIILEQDVCVLQNAEIPGDDISQSPIIEMSFNISDITSDDETLVTIKDNEQE